MLSLESNYMAQIIQEKIKRSIIKQTNKVIYFCEAENLSPNMAVHQIRRLFKRLRASLRLYKTMTYQNLFQEEIGAIQIASTSLTYARESYVNLFTFEKLLSHKDFLPEKKVKMVLEQLTSQNQDVINSLLENSDHFNTIKKTTVETQKQLETISGLPDTYAIFQELINSYEKSHRRFEKVLQETNSRNMHELRKILKRLMHQFELLKFIKLKFFTQRIIQLNSITEYLGEDHDIFVLSNEINNNYSKQLEPDELEAFNNIVHHQQEKMITFLTPKLKQFFVESPDEFTLRIKKYLNYIS